MLSQCGPLGRCVVGCIAVSGLLLAAAAPAAAQGLQRDAVLADASASQLCVDTINSFRSRQKLQPLARWVEGESLAAQQALADSRSGKPHGAFETYIQTPQGQNSSISQNECPGWPGPLAQTVSDCTTMMWAEGPGQDYQQHGHYINLSNPVSTRVACGFATARDGSLWVVQNIAPTFAPLDPQHAQQQDQLDDNSRPLATKFCLDTINSYRGSKGLPPYAPWPAGEQCAAQQAGSYARGQTPDLQKDACLAGQQYGQSTCSSSAGTLQEVVSGCLQSGWNEGPGADFNQHGDYSYMSSRQFTTAACGFARGADGSVQTVQIYK